MKKTIFLLSIFFLIISCNDNNYSSSGIFNVFSGKRILMKELVKDGGLFYDDGKPFNGIAFQMYDEKNIQLEKSYKDGKQDGEEKYWYRNGKIEQITNYKNGILNGKASAWHENGQIKFEGFYKENYPKSFFKSWYENGNKMEVAEYKIVSIDASISDQYKKNGGISAIPSSGTFDLSIMIGKHYQWHKNGQLKLESFYNEKGNLDGSYTKWNEDGSVYEKKYIKMVI